MTPGQKRILVVDDTPLNTSVITGVLEDTCRTKVATRGAKALALAAADEKPDIILLDVTKPEMDGYEVCRRLKADPTTREIPVIFLTGPTWNPYVSSSASVCAVSGPVLLPHLIGEQLASSGGVGGQILQNEASRGPSRGHACVVAK
jgi:AmiR/NasT family two-component response regulator